MTHVLSNLIKESFAVIALSNILAWFFYSTFRIGWPEIYFASNEKVALFVSTSSKRYLFFRLLPLLIIIVFSTSVLMKEKPMSQILVAAISSGIFYSLTTDGVAIIKLLLNSSSIKIFFNKASQIVLHLVAIISFGLIGFLAGYLSTFKTTQHLVPTPQGLIDNVWSAVIVAIGIVYINYIFKPKDMEIEYIFKKSKESIDKQILEEIKIKSAEYRANPILVEAICIIENIQRPKWLRIIERIFGKLKRSGSYGIMQVTLAKPISDIDSIEKSIFEYHKDTINLQNYKELYDHVKKYNPSNEYIDLVIKAMEYLDSRSVRNG